MDSQEQQEARSGVESAPVVHGDVQPGEPARQKRKKRWPIVVGVVAAVLVVAGAGLWIWHEQPSFCATVCHDTMGSYLETYENDAMLAGAHRQAGMACLDCHEPKIEEQVAELQVQISGDYRVPLQKMEVEDEFCLRDGCHTREEIVAGAADYVAPDGTKVNPHEQTIDPAITGRNNPHNSSDTTIACSTCHTSHRNSTEIKYCYDACHHTNTFETCSDCH